MLAPIIFIRGDVITGYRFGLDTPFLQSLGLTQGTTITSADSEKTACFESFYTPAFTEITCKRDCHSFDYFGVYKWNLCCW